MPMALVSRSRAFRAATSERRLQRPGDGRRALTLPWLLNGHRRGGTLCRRLGGRRGGLGGALALGRRRRRTSHRFVSDDLVPGHHGLARLGGRRRHRDVCLDGFGPGRHGRDGPVRLWRGPGTDRRSGAAPSRSAAPPVTSAQPAARATQKIPIVRIAGTIFSGISSERGAFPESCRNCPRPIRCILCACVHTTDDFCHSLEPHSARPFREAVLWPPLAAGRPSLAGAVGLAVRAVSAVERVSRVRKVRKVRNPGSQGSQLITQRTDGLSPSPRLRWDRCYFATEKET